MNIRKLASIIVTLVLVVSLIAGCTGKDESNGSKGGTQTLVIYSNSVSDGRGDWLKEKAAAQGFKVEIVEGGGGEITNRIMAEKNNPIADVVFGLSAMDYERFKAQGLLEQYKPVWAAEVSEGLNDKDDYYHSIVKQAILLIYNSDQYNEATAPKDWPDLWENEKFHHLYDSPSSFGGGTTRTVIASILVRHLDPKGQYGVAQTGWDAIRDYLKYGYHAAKGEDFYANLASGKVPFANIWSSGIATREEQHGVKAGIAKPETGVPFTVEQIAIVKGTKQLDAAKQFVDWFGSAEVQAEWSQQFSSMPANEKALESAPQEVKDLAASLKTQQIDWAFVSENIDHWIEKIELELMP